MAVTSVQEIWQGRSGKLELNRQAERTYVRIFRVVTDCDSDGVLTVTNAIPIVLGDYYKNEPPPPTTTCTSEDDQGARLKSIDAHCDDQDPRVWLCSYSYDSKLNIRPSDLQKNPTLRIPSWKFSSQQDKMPTLYDINGHAVTNSAYQPFESPPDIDYSRPTFTVEVYRATFNQSWIDAVEHSINSVDWSVTVFGTAVTYLAKTVKCNHIDVESVFENNQFCWKLTYNMERWNPNIQPGKWNPTRILDAGYYEVDGSGGTSIGGGAPGNLRLIRDAYGNPLSSQALLNGTGHKLGQGAAPVFLDYSFYNEVDWNGLIP